MKCGTVRLLCQTLYDNQAGWCRGFIVLGTPADWQAWKSIFLKFIVILCLLAPDVFKHRGQMATENLETSYILFSKLLSFCYDRLHDG
jgi:hypothetical protein